MTTVLEKKFTRLWQSLKKSSGVKSSSWFKKADTALAAKAEAYREALDEGKSGSFEDVLKLGKALKDFEEAFVKLVDAKALASEADVGKPSETQTLIHDVNRYKTELQHERNLFESRLKAALSAADNDPKRLESIEEAKKKELWKGFGIEL